MEALPLPCATLHSRKRRNISEMCEADESSRFPLNDLNQDLLERVLSWLPTPSFFRLTSVCKRWKSVADSASFKLACSRVPARHPWFFMVDSHSDHTQQPIVFDSAETNWKKLNHNQDSSASTPVAAASAAGLLCFLRPEGAFIIINPVTGSSRHLDSPFPASQQPIRAIAMTSRGEGFELVTVSGDLPHLKFRRYCSITRGWEEEVTLTMTRKADDGDCTPYFLSKCGNVVSTHIQRSPSKKYSSILIDDTLYYLSSSGTVVACNLTSKFVFEYPRLLPVSSEYSIDLVECGGRMFVVLLSEFLETASLRVWRWDETGKSWSQTAAMPPCMSHKLYGKKADINCSGGGDREMLVCVNSGGICSYVMCDLVENTWVELPSCCIDGQNKDFVSAFSFQPRIEALAG
ncbi:hypothetical protein C2S52_008646 [Perilla frutescens var. hirtella]|nr:hypothetical protein C2S51_017647 [Perilla frutescens var. frutescens]KAH6783687.1 hypothetical protein C2S52_008646 [Perilla frutescens var. hirtella]